MDVPEQRTVTVSTRPLRLAFVINERTSKEELIRIVEFNSVIWGGYYNLLIPTDGQSLPEEWWHLLISDSPDKIVICGEISTELANEMYERIEPYCLWKWSAELLERQVVEGDAFGSMPIAHSLLHLHETNRSSLTGLIVPIIPIQSPYRECVAAQIGTLSQSYVEFYVKGLNGTIVNRQVNDLETYLTQLTQYEKNWTPIELTKFNLSPVTQMGSVGFTIVLAGEDTAKDLCLFWNLRMRPALGRVATTLIPYGSIKTQEDVSALAKWCDDTVVGTNYIVLASASLPKSKLVDLRTKLSARIKASIEHVDVWFENFRMNSVRTFEKENQEEQMVERGSFRMKSPRPAFSENSGLSEWVVDVAFKRDRQDSRNAFLPPTFAGLSSLLSGIPPAWIINSYGLPARLTKDRLSYRARASQDVLQGNLPSDETLFRSLLKSKGYAALTTDKCRYARGLIGLMGGLQALAILRNAGVRELFYKMGNDQNTYTPKEMMAWLKPDPNATRDSFAMISDLALKKAFLRGYKIQCPACDLTRWYGVAEISESMSCAGCLTSLQPPIDADFRYRLNELVARGLNQGTTSVMLTLLFLESLSQGFMAVPGLEVNKTRPADVDIIGCCDGHLFLAECKDLREGSSPSTIGSVSSQLSSLLEIASDVGAEMVFLSLLVSSVPASLQTKIGTLKKKHKSIAIHVLTMTDLELGHKTRATIRTPGNAAQGDETPSTLTDFLPTQTYKRKGWVREPGDRSVSF